MYVCVNTQGYFNVHSVRSWGYSQIHLSTVKDFFFQWCKMVAGKSRQKKLIHEHSSNEVSLTAAFVRTLTMVRVIWIPLRRAKWPPIVRG